MLNFERMIEMLFSKKNRNQITLMHYEGLKGFVQDMPCSLTLDDSTLTFSKVKPDLSATLQLSQIQAIEFLPEVNFLTQYHNSGIPTAKMGQKFYWVIKFTNISGEASHIAVWNVGGLKDRKFMDSIKSKLTPVSNYTL